jgi:hypothetical protein
MANSEHPGARPTIGDYAFLSDCHSVALLSRAGSIDWCCMPRVDSASVFARILDHDRGGFCALAPTEPGASAARRYLHDTLVLETTVRTAGGEARVIDCFAMREGGKTDPHRQLLRIVEGDRGSMELSLRVAPRLDYGEVRPWLRHRGKGVWSAMGGNDALVIRADFELTSDGDHDLVATFEVRAGQRAYLSLTYARTGFSRRPAPRPAEPYRARHSARVNNFVVATVGSRHKAGLGRRSRGETFSGRVEGPDQCPNGSDRGRRHDVVARGPGGQPQLGLPPELGPGLGLRGASPDRPRGRG